MINSTLLTNIDAFFFYRESPLKAAIFRIALGTVLLLNLLLLNGHLIEWFSNQGILSIDFVRERTPNTFSIFFWNDTPSFIEASYLILLLLTAAYTIGIYPRLMAIPIFLLTISFHNRNPYLFHAGDMVLRLVLFLNIFIDSGQRLSLLHRMRNQNPPKETICGWPFRIMQIQLCILYFFACASKTTSPMWMNGEYIFAMANFPGRGFFDFLWLREVPWLANIATYLVLATEMSFPFLYWLKSTRNLVIVAAFLMHLGIMLTINTVYFSEIMFVVLVGVVRARTNY